MDLEYLRDLLTYWADRFDWRARSGNQSLSSTGLPTSDGEPHAFGASSPAGRRRAALILTHGWPSTFLEMLPLIDRLGDTYDLVVPSLPGYAYSPPPPHVGVDRAYVAAQWHRLMHGLGYERYGAHGGDFSTVATHMALIDPDRMIGIHLSTPEMAPYAGPDAPPLTARGARVPCAGRALGRDRARLQRHPVDPATDARIRADRLAIPHSPHGSWRSGGSGRTPTVTSTPGSAATRC